MTRIVGYPPLLSNHVEVYLFDVYFTSNFAPSPVVGKTYASEHPGFYLFPSVFGKEPSWGAAELLFNFGKAMAPRSVPVPVHAQDEQINHTIVLLDDLCQPLGLQCFVDSAKQRICQYRDRRPPLQMTKEPLEQWSEDILIVTEVFGNNENVQPALSSRSP